MAELGWHVLLVVLSIYCQDVSASGNHIIAINLHEKKMATIPCGGNNPPYTYTIDGFGILVKNTTTFYTVTGLEQSNNGDGYCCSAIGDVTCYTLNITYRPYLELEKFTGLPPSPVFGEVYDFECPYESNPPADYNWTRVSSCDSDSKHLSWPSSTIIYNNKKSLRLDGVIPAHNGFYFCKATNAYGSKSFCFWNKIDVGCVGSEEDRSISPVATIEALQNTTVEQYDTITINCNAQNVGISTTIQWIFNGSLLQTSDTVAFITGDYNNDSCSATNQLVITNFTAKDEGVYSCFVNRSGVSYHSDNKSFYLDDPLLNGPNQIQGNLVMPLSAGLGGVVLLFAAAIGISVMLLLKSRRNILAQRVDTRQYTKPPTNLLHLKYDVLPVYAESDRHFVETQFLTPLAKEGYLILDHHLNFIPGNAIADNILTAIKESRFVLPIITKNFLKSKYCVFELEQSVIKMIKTKTTCIIPVTADLALLPECLKNLVTSVILDEKDPLFSTHIDRIKNNIGSVSVAYM